MELMHFYSTQKFDNKFAVKTISLANSRNRKIEEVAKMNEIGQIF
jgi:hypothetical protein